MNQKRPLRRGLFAVSLVGLLALTSCVSFKLVSQRPTHPQSVDAIAAATSGEEPAAAPAPTAGPQTTTNAGTGE